MDKDIINSQIKRFRKGFPWLDIVAPATPSYGIKILDGEERKKAAGYLETADVKGKCKFVPASGAASRMFKDIFAGMEEPNDAVRKLADGLEGFAFYSPGIFGPAPHDPRETARLLLGEEGLGYGSKPKGVLLFHRYADEVRTALAEHFVEGQAYMRNDDGSVNLTITISPEHRELFEQAVNEIKDSYEKRYGVRYNVDFTYQSKDTDTIAVTPDNKPFLKDDGTPLFRPAGHGALIHNLSEVDSELVTIKNIDNVSMGRNQEITSEWKRILMGRALQLRDRIFGYIFTLRQISSSKVDNFMSSTLQAYQPLQEDVYASDEVQQLCNEIETFLREEFCIEMPEARNCRERAEQLMDKLDRPLRVCGMVKNEGEPGGGPFVVRAKDGSTSLQILEKAQIDMSDPKAAAAFKASTHFNSVDIVCCLLDADGRKFDLGKHVDEETGLISAKSYQGRELKALELPGLWNGSMSDWNTQFVEVPIETFNPVKTVLDLLRPAHRQEP